MAEDKASRLDGLADEVRGLRDSSLYELRKQNGYHVVFGEGNPDAQVVLIGEAPGEQEAKSGRPFVGRAGRVLDGLLESAGIQREQVYITNVVKDRPPENRNPTAAEIDEYLPFLIRQIDIIEPTVIVTLGRIATDTMLGRFDLPQKGKGLGELHGKPIATRASYGDVKLLPMYHPAAGFYNQELGAAMRDDFRELQELT